MTHRESAISEVDLASHVEIEDWIDEQDAQRNDEEEDQKEDKDDVDEWPCGLLRLRARLRAVFRQRR